MDAVWKREEPPEPEARADEAGPGALGGARNPGGPEAPWDEEGPWEDPWAPELDEERIDELAGELDSLHAQASGIFRRMLGVVRRLEGQQAWELWGARDLPHFLSLH